MNISQLKNWKQRALPAGRQGEVATLFTVAALVLMAAGTLLGSARVVQDNVLKLGSFAYDNSFRAHFYKGPTFEEKDRIPGQPNSGYTLIRGSLCFTGTTIPSQLQQFWVHTPQDPNQGYPQKACDNTNADTKDDCIVHEGRTVKYIAPQTSRPYCDSPDVGKANWRAWDFTLKLQAPYSKDLCSGLFVSSSSSFVSRDPIEIDMNAWHRYLGQHGVNCGPTPTTPANPTNTPVPTDQPPVTNVPTIIVPTAKPTIDTVITPGPFVTHSINPTVKPRCPDPKKPCPSITPVQDCRNDIQCSNANPCPNGYVCLTSRADPLGRGICASKNPKCNPTATPTPPVATISPQPSCNDCVSQGKAYRCTGDVAFPGQSPAVYCSNTDTGRPASCQLCTPVSVTSSPEQAKIRGDIIVNSCKKPDAVSTIICEKNNPTKCMDVATPVTFVGQDPTNPNKWLYTYEHTQAPSASGSLEPIVKNALYENMQAFAQYTSTGLIREAGRVGFPAAQLGNLRAYATIPSSQTEAIVNYEVPQNNIVCPPTTPSVAPPTAIPSPAMCKYSAVVEVIDEATGLPVPVSQMGDTSKWGLANDKQDPKPRTLFTISGDMVGGERVSKYKFQTDTLTFRDGIAPDLKALYTKGAKAQVNLFIDTKKWQITSKIPCQGRGCPNPLEPVAGRNIDQYGSTVDGFNFDCDTNITTYGWKVKQLPPSNPENPGQPGQPAGQCVLRDPVNAVKCSPKNVKAVRKSTSTVAVSWTAPDASCNFTPGSNGDYYRIDLIDMTENPRSVITTCDKITSTSRECTLSPTYHPNSSGKKGTFQAGHNYVASVYAFKEIPGSVDMCVSNNGNGPFDRPAKDNGGDAPEPTTAPIGGSDNNGDKLLTRQLDWMINNVGVCWAGWSHGQCNLAYNGTNKWAQSITDGRFKCYAPYGADNAVPGQETVVIGLMKGVGQINGIQTKRVDCIGNIANACIAAKDTNVSQCESDLAVANTTNGQSIDLKPNECWSLNANLGVTKLPSCPEDPKDVSNQPPPRTPGQPQPTAKPGETQPTQQPGPGQTSPTGAGSGLITVVTENRSALETYPSIEGYYRTTSSGENISTTLVPNNDGSATYSIPDFDPDQKEYFVDIYLYYALPETPLKTQRATARLHVNQNEYNSIGVWDTEIVLDPTNDPEFDSTIPTPQPGDTWKDNTDDNKYKRSCVSNEKLCVSEGGTVFRGTTNLICANRNAVKCLFPIIAPRGSTPRTPAPRTPAPNAKPWVGLTDDSQRYRRCFVDDAVCTSRGGKINKSSNWKCETTSLTKCEVPVDKSTIIVDGITKLEGVNTRDAKVVLDIKTIVSGNVTKTQPIDADTSRGPLNLTSFTNTIPVQEHLDYRVDFKVVSKRTDEIVPGYEFKSVGGKINCSGKTCTSTSSKGGGYILVEIKKTGASGNSLLSSISLQNNSSSPITSVSIASCDSANKCASNTVSVALAAGANTKFKPTFSVPSTTRRLGCVIKFGNGTSKQCTPQLVTGSNGLQFSITTQANNTVTTTVLSPLKTADTNRDCKVTSADATGLRDLDGNGSVNAADTSLFFSYIGQNACN